MGHTPGPWMARENGDGGDFLIQVSGFASIIAEVIAEDVPAIESEANARLIAAAPAYAMAWAMVPEEIKQSIYNALYSPETDWVERSILSVEGQPLTKPENDRA